MNGFEFDDSKLFISGTIPKKYLKILWVNRFVLYAKIANWRMHNLIGLGKSLKFVIIEDVLEKEGLL